MAKVLELQHQSFNEYSGLISFKIDWFDLLAVQGTLKSLVQHHRSKRSGGEKGLRGSGAGTLGVPLG